MSSNIDATQQVGGVVGGVGGMLTFLARCTNIDATQQGGGVVGGVGGMLTFLARCTNIDPRTKKINPSLWDWIYSWMWRRNCKGDAWGAMPKLFHWRTAASAQKGW